MSINLNIRGGKVKVTLSCNKDLLAIAKDRSWNISKILETALVYEIVRES
jgi:post-segregation antitoxin (ccd killing protein)